MIARRGDLPGWVLMSDLHFQLTALVAGRLDSWRPKEFESEIEALEFEERGYAEGGAPKQLDLGAGPRIYLVKP